jgi:hypothetical protein
MERVGCAKCRMPTRRADSAASEQVGPSSRSPSAAGLARDARVRDITERSPALDAPRGGTGTARIDACDNADVHRRGSLHGSRGGSVLYVDELSRRSTCVVTQKGPRTWL